MKKLKLKALQLGAIETLTRTQLKNVLGGVAMTSSLHQCCESDLLWCSNCTQSNCGADYIVVYCVQ